MNKSQISEYLHKLERELRIRGLYNPDTLAEAESHLLDAWDRGIKNGLDPQAAQQQALNRFGTARLVAHKFAIERNTMKQKILLITAALFGLFVAYVDSRPTWNDTGITVFALLIGSGIIGLLADKRPWLFALAVGIWLPLWYIVTTHNLSMIIVLAFPFVGVYIGWAVHLAFRKLRQTG
jgi:hypothetical protein